MSVGGVMTHPTRLSTPKVLQLLLTMKYTLKARQDGSVHRTSLIREEHQDDGIYIAHVAWLWADQEKKKINIKSCPTSLTAHIQAIAGARHKSSGMSPSPQTGFFPAQSLSWACAWTMSPADTAAKLLMSQL